MRARYYRGEHEGKSWGGPWAEATITVAGEPAETPTPEPVQQPAKEDPVQEKPAEEDTTAEAGTIDTLTATDDDAGQLVLTWDPPAAPNAAPTDYHVNWAKSSEDYPADTAEAGNAHPTTTTHTLAGLEYDTDYNVRVRARYTDGENAASPWNGPWTETTARVKLPLARGHRSSEQPPSRPDGEVLLFWFGTSRKMIPSLVIRYCAAPDADSLVVIEDDTGSSSTSYTDETPPAGQTHTYGVKARNASGLGPQSDTGTATVPEPEEELVTAQQSSEETLVSNLEKTTSDSANAGSVAGTQRETTIQFTTGSNAPGYHMTSVQLYLTKIVATDTPTPQVSIRADNGGSPSDTVLYTLTTSTAITINWNLVTFTAPDEVTLQPDTLYWLHVTATGGTLGIQQTASNNEDTESQADWSIGDDRVFRTDGGTWVTSTASDTLKMKILGQVIPPEPTENTLVSNLEKTASDSANAGSVAGTQRETAIQFTTGIQRARLPHDQCAVIPDQNCGNRHSHPTGLHTRPTTEDPPVTPSCTPSPRPRQSPINWKLITFTTPDEVTLQPDTLYWLYVNATGGTLGVQQTASDDEDTESQADWSIGDDRVFRTDGGAWVTSTASDTLKMKILGQRHNAHIGFKHAADCCCWRCPGRLCFRQQSRNCHAVHDGQQRIRLPPNEHPVIPEQTFGISHRLHHHKRRQRRPSRRDHPGPSQHVHGNHS